MRRHLPTRITPLLILLLGGLVGGGCTGPTRTAGTRALAPKDMAVLSIPQIPKEAHVQIHTIQFDGGGDAYEIGKGRDFYLPPRDHTASLTFVAHLPDLGGGIIAKYMSKESLKIPGPKKIPLGALAAGKSYELAVPTDFEKILESGEFSLVREKKK